MSRWVADRKGKADVFASEIRLRDESPSRRVKVNKLLKLLKDGPNKEDVRETLSGSH